MWLLFFKRNRKYIFIYILTYIFSLFLSRRYHSQTLSMCPLRKKKNYNKIKTLLFYHCSKVGQIIKSKSFYKYIKWQIEQGLYFWRKDSLKCKCTSWIGCLALEFQGFTLHEYPIIWRCSTFSLSLSNSPSGSPAIIYNLLWLHVSF